MRAGLVSYYHCSAQSASQRIHVAIWYMLVETPLGPRYIPYTYMDPLGMMAGAENRHASSH